MHTPQNKSILNVVIFAGIFSIVSSGAMIAHQIREMKGADEKASVILALEFTPNSENTQKILNLWSLGFDNQVEHEKFLGNLRSQVYLDFPFLFAYSSFFAFFAIYLLKKDKRKIFYLGILLGIWMLIGDFVENQQILGIIDCFDTANKTMAETGDYALLRFSTLLKWGSLSLSFLLFAIYFIKGRSWKRWFMVFLCLVPFITGLVVFYSIQILGSIIEPGSHSLWLSQVNFLSIVAGLFVLFGYAVFQRFKSN